MSSAALAHVGSHSAVIILDGQDLRERVHDPASRDVGALPWLARRGRCCRRGWRWPACPAELVDLAAPMDRMSPNMFPGHHHVEVDRAADQLQWLQVVHEQVPEPTSGIPLSRRGARSHAIRGWFPARPPCRRWSPCYGACARLRTPGARCAHSRTRGIPTCRRRHGGGAVRAAAFFCRRNARGGRSTSRPSALRTIITSTPSTILGLEAGRVGQRGEDSKGTQVRVQAQRPCGCPTGPARDAASRVGGIPLRPPTAASSTAPDDLATQRLVRQRGCRTHRWRTRPAAPLGVGERRIVKFLPPTASSTF